MKKTMLAAALMAWSATTFAQINCSSIQGEERLDIRIIDTFLERTAFIDRVHPNLEFPLQEVGVKALENIRTVIYMNEEVGFELVIDKLFPERRLPPLYRAQLTYGPLSTEMKCTIE